MFEAVSRINLKARLGDVWGKSFQETAKQKQSGKKKVERRMREKYDEMINRGCCSLESIRFSPNRI